MDYPKVLIGIATFNKKEYCRERFVENIKRIDYPNFNWTIAENTRKPVYYHKLARLYPGRVVRTPTGENSREALVFAQEYFRKKALKEGYDYLLLIESDVFPPKDIIWRLLRHGKPVVGGVYRLTNGGLCIYVTTKKKLSNGSRQLEKKEEASFFDKDLQRVHGMGLGCTLIHKSILKEFPFWFSSADDERMKGMEIRKYSDTYFYLDMHNKGIKVYADTTSMCVHMPGGNKII